MLTHQDLSIKMSYEVDSDKSNQYTHHSSLLFVDPLCDSSSFVQSVVPSSDPTLRLDFPASPSPSPSPLDSENPLVEPHPLSLAPRGFTLVKSPLSLVDRNTCSAQKYIRQVRQIEVWRTCRVVTHLICASSPPSVIQL